MPRRPKYKITSIKTRQMPAFIKNRNQIIPDRVAAHMRFFITRISQTGKGLVEVREDFTLQSGKITTNQIKKDRIL